MIAPLGNDVQRAIKSLRTRLWQGTLRSQVQPRPHPNFARLESSYRFLVSLYASSRESLLYFRETFSPLRLILSLKSVFSFLFSLSFFLRGFPSLREEGGTHPRCSPTLALPFDGRGRHSSRISSHLNGPGYKYATA